LQRQAVCRGWPCAFHCRSTAELANNDSPIRLLGLLVTTSCNGGAPPRRRCASRISQAKYGYILGCEKIVRTVTVNSGSRHPRPTRTGYPCRIRGRVPAGEKLVGGGGRGRPAGWCPLTPGGAFDLKRIAFLAMSAPLALSGSGVGAAAAPAEALDRLVAAYPDVLARHDGEHIYWRDGTVMAVSDGVKEKSFDQLLKNASILDQFKLSNRPGRLEGTPAVNEDPGRFRNEAFFQKLYGDCRKGEVDRHMVSLIWLPRSWGKIVRATDVEGVADQLKAVSAEIDALPPAISRAAYPTAGILSCRPVADTGKMSMHGYGSAIDLNLNFSDYWLWQKKTDPIPYRNRMPQDVVDIFEHHGFIWGGKWYHYDTMHFEYRPELIGR
jgi:hypothetical protein